MNRIEHIFGKPKILLPVIHVQGEKHAEKNAQVAMANGADGILLINQGSTWQTTLAAARTLALDHPDWWVGVNLLGQENHEVMRMARNTFLKGVWSDHAGVQVQTPRAGTAFKGWKVGVEEASKAVSHRDNLAGTKHVWGGLYLAGVAFKYQPEVPQEAWSTVAKLAVLAGVDVVVTSGAATGAAAPREKLEIMREALGEHPLGIASGISIENVDQYPAVDVFIVASSLLKPGSGENFDPKKMRSLADRIHKLC